MSKDLSADGTARRLFQEQVTEWQQNAVTIQFLKAIKARREEVKELDINGGMNHDQAVGMATAYQAVLDWTYEDE